MKKLLAPIIIFFLIICTSCKDNKEIHEISFVSSIGIDYKIDTNVGTIPGRKPGTLALRLYSRRVLSTASA